MMEKNVKKVAQYLKNGEFLVRFEEGLGLFAYYQDELNRILEEGIRIRDRLQSIELELKSVFGDVFPDVVLSRMTEYVFARD